MNNVKLDNKFSSSSADKITIAYISQTFPALTQTFIYREIIALRELGFTLVTCAIWTPNIKQLSKESRHFVGESLYIFPINWTKFFKAHIRVFSQSPLRYLSTLFFVTTGRGEGFKNRIRTFFHFLEAVSLAPELEDRKVTHIQAHFTINAATIALVISRLLNISFSFTAHNIFYTDRVILKKKVGEAKFIVTISNFSKQFLLNLVPGNKIDEKIHTIHCGISLEEFSPSTNKKEDQVPVLLFVAQLEERKGAPYLIEACKLLSGSGLDYECILIGDGAQKQLAQDLIDKYLLENRVKLVGALPQEKIKSYLDSADIFVLPCIVASNGDVDGIPVSLMEAMAMEIPTVSTRVSGIPELIIDGKSGILVDQKDEVALGNAIQNLIGDPELRKTLGVNGRQRIIADFNVQKTASELGKLFTDYLGNNIGT